MASIGHFAQSYITNLYDKQQKKIKLPADWGGGGHMPPVPPPPPRSYATGEEPIIYDIDYKTLGKFWSVKRMIYT